MVPIAKIVSRLTPDQYLPITGNRSEPTYAWSVSLNLALWMKVKCEMVQTTSLYICFEDSRGEQELLIDSQLVDHDSELLFSNLVKLPVKGTLKNVSLMLIYQSEDFSFEVDELFVRVIESQPPDPELKKTG